MKYLVISDIHGCLPSLECVLEFFERENYDLLVILGDILNYGPRNGLPEGLDAPGIVEKLNAMADKIIAVRGNCDSEVDQMLLKFPIMADYALLITGQKRFFMTHGHKYNPQERPWLGIDALFFGHTHQWQLEQDTEGLIICNSGSITFPKGGDTATFATIDDDNTIRIRTLNGDILKELNYQQSITYDP